MTEELKACPFCGDEAGPEIDGDEFATANSTYTIFCNGCHASAATEHSYTEAATRWNQRPTPADPGEVREKVARELAEHLASGVTGTPDDHGMDDCDDFDSKHPMHREVYYEAADAILSLLSPLQVTNCLETGNGSKSFREGVESAAKVLRARSAELRTPSGRAKAEWHESDALMVAGELDRIATAIRALASGKG